VCGEGPDREESGHSRERNAELLSDGQSRQDHDAIVLKKMQAS
jgi:hypothetical protein